MKAYEQVAPQLIPVGLLITVPLPVPVLFTVRMGVRIVKLAVTVVVVNTLIVQIVLVPEQPSPPQPVKIEPVDGVAVSVTKVPET